MGWFWADQPARLTTGAPPHTMPRDSGKPPPPGCPMHESSKTSGPLPIASTSASDTTGPLSRSGGGGGCPVKQPTLSSSISPSSSSSSSTDPSQPHTSSGSSVFGKLNPLNYMPSSIPQSRAQDQTVDLPISRETSSIPRGDTDENWEYPSPQQMYNAMVRKGYDDTPVDAVEAMVAVHNFLNEGAWAEIEAWEARFARGLAFGWRACRSGEEGFEREYRTAKSQPDWADLPAPRLTRFMGRPGELTPKAWMVQKMGAVVPSMRGEPPFDRHDWFVQRQLANGSTREVRYVIDYYSAPPEPTGEPVFYLDVRPAVDGPSAAMERLLRWGGDFWYRASGGAARQPPI